MKKYLIVIAVLLMGATYGPYHADVVRVIDGDTVIMNLNTEPDHYWRVSVRIAGIDTPEIHKRKGWPACQIPLGLSAKAYTVTWFKDAADIQVIGLHLGSYTHRAIGEVTALKNGLRRNLGDDLLTSGHARKEIIGKAGQGWCGG